MRENPKTKMEHPERSEATFGREVGAAEIRKLRAKRRGVPGIWFGLGMLGLIGWAVTVPTLLGVLLGVFIDRHYQSQGQEQETHSWTLALLLIGLFLGCLNAWHWVAKEEKNIREEEKKDE